MKLNWRLSPSRIERYFSQSNCLRALVAGGITNTAKTVFGFEVPASEKDASATAGEHWEKDVLDILKQRYHLVYEEQDKKNAQAFIEHLSQLVDNGAKRAYFYQPTLSISKELCDRIIGDPDVSAAINGDNCQIQIDISQPCYPDFVRAKKENGKYILSIVDVKLAKRPKIEHKIQICFYILLLKDFIKQNGLDKQFEVNENEGYLYNRGQKQEKPFSAVEPMRFLRRFLREEIPHIVKCASERQTDGEMMESLPYRISQKCEWCENYEKCIGLCKARNEQIMLLPYLSLYAQDYLYELRKRQLLKSFDIDEFSAFCSKKQGEDLLKQNIYWKRFLPDKDAYLSALKEGSPKVYNRSCASYEMPAYEDVQIILTAQKDEGYDLCYAFGIYVKYAGSHNYSLPEIPEEHTYADGIQIESRSASGAINYSAVVTDMAYQTTLERLFINVLYGTIKDVDDHNAQAPDEEKVSLQFYVMDNYELTNIEQLLYGVIDRIALSETPDMYLYERVTAILLCMQGSKLVESEGADKPQNVIYYPTIVLTSVINGLFVIPAQVSYSLSDVCNAFFDVTVQEESDLVHSIETSEFTNIKSNVFNNRLINRYWNDPAGNSGVVSEILTHIGTRLNAESIIIEKMRTYNSAGIRRNAEFFTIPQIDYAKNIKFSDLRFEARYEQSLAAKRIRAIQCMNIEQAITEGKILSLECIKTEQNRYSVSCTYKVLNSKAIVSDFFFAAYICEDTQENRLSIPFFLLDSNQGIKGHYIYINNCEITKENEETVIKRTHKRNRCPKLNGKYLLFEAYMDCNTITNLKALYSVDKYNVTYMLQPELNCDELSSFTESELLEKAGAFGGTKFSYHQYSAFQHFNEHKLTLVLGPPGSGKTDFIARSLVVLAEDAINRNQRFTVLVSANSHAAIENILFKVAEKKKSKGINPQSLSVNKLKHLDSSNPSSNDVQVIDPASDINKIMDAKTPLIIGGTVWSIYNLTQSLSHIWEYVDVIVIDEASQMRMVDAIIPLSVLNTNTGRLLVVGDEEQLPAIINGKYTKDSTRPYLLGSLFRYLHDCDILLNNKNDKKFTRKLEENYRMNDIISRYSKERIYDRYPYFAKYRAANAEIGFQTLEQKIKKDDMERVIESDDLKPLTDKLSEKEKETLKQILDPTYPLILCCPTGETPYDRKETEVNWVTLITKCLQKAFFDHAAANGKAYTAHDFWGSIKDKGDFGIISPHHEHIIRLKSEISKTPAPFTEDYGDLFIGTVDKLQGQEREAVVVSYGISDPEQAISEDEFVYSRNRLNVAITRAKKKCIVFLSDVVLDYPIEALAIDDEDVLKGIDYVCGFRDFMQKSESDSDIDSCAVEGKLTVYRKRLIGKDEVASKGAEVPLDDGTDKSDSESVHENEQPASHKEQPNDKEPASVAPTVPVEDEEFLNKTYGNRWRCIEEGVYEVEVDED